MIEDVYKDNILEHYKEPRNSGRMENATHNAREVNPVCGDQIEMFLKVNDGVVEDISFLGDGCAISQASCSMLTEKIKGKSLNEIKMLGRDDILKLLGIEIGAVRMKCALLSLQTLFSAIKKSDQ